MEIPEFIERLSRKNEKKLLGRVEADVSDLQKENQILWAYIKGLQRSFVVSIVISAAALAVSLLALFL